MKTREYECPKCSEDIDLETIDTEFDDSLLSLKLRCFKCGATWHEYFKLHYDGYSYKGEYYDADGSEVID